MPTETTILVVTNRKGGSGKTTTSVNLAAEFAALGRRTLLVDLDTQGHCAVGLDVATGRETLTVHHLFRDTRARLLAAVHPTAWPNLHLVPADPLFEHGMGTVGQLRLSRAITEEKLADRYDVIILDTPPSLDDLLLNGLCAARWVVVPFLPHHLSGEGIRSLARVLFKVKSSVNPQLQVLAFLPVMLDRRICQHRTVSEGVSRQFGQGRLLSGIRSDIKLVEAFAHRRPIRAYMPGCRGAEDYASTTCEIIDRIRYQPLPPTSR